MLKTNSKAARNNIRSYIMDHYDSNGYDLPEAITFTEVATNIYNTYKSEKRYTDSYYIKHNYSDQEIFTDWCTGLPSILDTCYYYNRSAIDDLGAILEETEAEKARYKEDKAANLLSYLIYREIIKAIK